MDTRREGDIDTMTKLYEASMEGCVLTLSSLLQKDPLLLSKISLTSFAETPLHISALLGHTNFTRQLLTHKPKLALELDSRNRSPLHLASAEGHAEIVQALLQESYGDMCLVKDQDGRTPLHYAAMRGRVGVIKLLIGARGDAVFEVDSGGETALHLCVQYNHLEALKVLVEFVLNGFDKKKEHLLNLKEQAGGNTVLHLAVMLKQIETVKYLVSIPHVKQDILNHKGYKASDLVDQTPRDFNSFKLRLILMENQQSANILVCSEDQPDHHRADRIKQSPKRPWTLCLWKWIFQLLKTLQDTTRAWLESDTLRGSIMVVATLIAQMTFQTAVNPPGGVWQQSLSANDASGELSCSKELPCVAGTAVLANVWSHEYVEFTKCNSVAFLASLSVILLVVGGFPLSNAFCVWLVTIALLVTLTFAAMTFLMGMDLVTPNVIFDSVFTIYGISKWVWIGLLAMLGLFHTVFVLIWLFNKSRRLIATTRFRACYG